MALTFEWDSRKADMNLRKHAVSFEEAATVFAGRTSVTISHPDHSTPREHRFITIGASLRHRVLVVVHCDRANRIRVISARRASKREKSQYEQGW